MAFRFKRKESIADGFARLAREQIGDAVAALEESADVHAARKSIKRVRGLLQLFRRALPEGSFEREDDALRSGSRNLANLRDAKVRIAVFDSVVKGLKAPGIASARRKLIAAFRAAATGASPVREAINALRTVAAHLPALPPDSGWSVLRRGLKATYRRARKAHAAAHEEVSTGAIHVWRRRSKSFEYQLRLLRKIDPPAMKRSLRAASRLNELLGDDHDLAALDRTLASTTGLPEEWREKLRARIQKRRKKLQRGAFALGSKLFFEKPAVVVNELGRQWKRWRRGARK